MLASPVKTIAKKPAASRVPPMIELCHDALARGVLEQHGGLPPSWIELFKAHPAAWQQLTDQVLDSKRDKGPFEPSSIISIVFVQPAFEPGCIRGEWHESEFFTVLAPGTVLPRWFAILLHAYVESVLATPGQSLPVDGNGGHRIRIGCAGHVASMWDVLCDDCRVDRILKTTRLELFDAFQLDVRRELEEEIAFEAAEGNPLTDDDDMEILEMFEGRAAEVLRDHINDNACEMNLDWFDKVKREHEGSYERYALRAPHVSLLLDWSTPDRDWD